MNSHEVTTLSNTYPHISVDEAVEEAAAAVRMLSEARSKAADTTASMASMFEQLRDSYTSLGREYEELQAVHALVVIQRDEANVERDAAVADVRKLIRAFQLFVNAASNAGEALMTQDDRVKGLLGLYKSIVRYGPPDLPAQPQASLQASQPASRPAVSVRPLAPAAPAAPVEAAASPQAAPVAIEDEISVALGNDRLLRDEGGSSVVEIHDHRRPAPKEEPKLPEFLTRRREAPELDEGERKARSSVASGFGLFAGKRGTA